MNTSSERRTGSLDRVNVTARPYNEQKEVYEQKVFEFFVSTAQKYNWPQDEAPWNVYLLAKNLVTHYALMFEHDNNKFFIDLWINKDNIEKTPQVIMRFDMLGDKFEEYKEIPLGTITKSFPQIFQTAYNVMEKMGEYKLVMNNCQDYASELAKALGVPKEIKTGRGTILRGEGEATQEALEIIMGIPPPRARL